MNIRFGSIICLVFSVLAFRAQGLDFERFNIIQKIGEYIDYMLGEDPVRYVRYFYVYVICRFLKGKLSNQTLPLSPTLFWAYLNGSLVFYHAELAARLPLERQENKVMGFLWRVRLIIRTGYIGGPLLVNRAWRML